jgi:hypothetical protein
MVMLRIPITGMVDYGRIIIVFKSNVYPVVCGNEIIYARR